MTTSNKPCRLAAWLTFCLTIVALLPALALAQPAATGSISGRVFNPATSQYVRNAEVRLQGTDRVVTTESDGSFILTNVPAGPATVTVTYTGYNTATVNLNVSAGSTATADVNLTNALDTSGETVKLQAFTVSTEREGNAKAIQDQKQAMTVSNIIASDSFGDVAGGNVGEFLKYLPGIQMDYVEADARNPRIRGLPAQYTTVTYGGMDLASADGFIQNNGTDNSGGAGSAGRSFGFDSVSLSSIDAIEVSFTTNASQGAGAAAGSIDLRPKHAYQSNGQQIGIDVSAMGNSEEMFWHKVVRPDDKPERLILPNGRFEYGNSFFNHRLGVLFSVNESNFFNEQRQYVPGYDTTPTAASPAPIVLTKIQYKDGPKLTEQSTMSFTLDFKATDQLSLSLIGINTNYGMFTSNRSFGISTTRAALVGHGDGWTSWDNVPVTLSATATASSYLRKRTHGYSYLPSFEYKTGNLFLTGALVASASENNYAGNESYKLPGASIGGISAPTGISATATRSADDLYSWKVVQTAGPDWANVANYKASATGSPTFGWDGRYNRELIYQAKLDARYVLPLSIPTWIKTGTKISETTYTYQNPTSWLSYNYVGPGGGLGGSYGLYPSAAVFSQGHGGYFISDTGGTPAITDHNTISGLFMSHPEYFVHNDSAANYLASFVSNPKYIKEQVDAAYGMFDSKLNSHLEVQAGARWERTRDETKDFNPVGSAQVVKAGYPVTATTGQASTIPGIAYQYFSNPRIARSNSYDGLFPSAGVKYLFNRNLQALFGYSYTLTRPAFGDLSGTYIEDDVALTVTAPNPKLKPQYANNYSGQLAYYFGDVGKLVVGAFENDVKNFQQTSRLQGAVTDLPGYEDPSFDTYTLVQKNNIAGTVIYRGATVDYSQTLSFLPKPFNGLNVFANYARTYTTLTVPDPTQLHVSGSPYNFGWLPGIAPHVISGGVSYRFRRVSVGVKARWQADMGTTNTYNTWLNQSIKYDVNASYNLTEKLSLYFYSRNITNEPDHTYIGTNRQQIGGGRAIEYYGSYLYAGVRARF